MTFSKKYILSITLVVSVMAALFIIVSAVNVYVRQHLFQTMTHAVETGNVNEIDRRVDWESIRRTFKEELLLKAESLFGKSSGFDLSEKEIDNIVNFYVQPSNIPSLFYYHKTFASDIKPEEFIQDIAFNGIDEVVMTLSYPAKDDKPWVKSLEPIRAVFVLENAEWKLKKIHAPLYIMPQKAPNVDEKGIIQPLSEKQIDEMAEKAVKTLEEATENLSKTAK